MKLKQLIFVRYSRWSASFTSGVVQPAQAAVGMDTPAPDAEF